MQFGRQGEGAAQRGGVRARRRWLPERHCHHAVKAWHLSCVRWLRGWRVSPPVCKGLWGSWGTGDRKWPSCRVCPTLTMADSRRKGSTGLETSCHCLKTSLRAPFIFTGCNNTCHRSQGIVGIVPLMSLIVKGSLLIAVGEQRKQEVQSWNTFWSEGSRILLPVSLGVARCRLHGVTLNFKCNNPD